MEKYFAPTAATKANQDRALALPNNASVIPFIKKAKADAVSAFQFAPSVIPFFNFALQVRASAFQFIISCTQEIISALKETTIRFSFFHFRFTIWRIF